MPSSINSGRETPCVIVVVLLQVVAVLFMLLLPHAEYAAQMDAISITSIVPDKAGLRTR